MEVTSECYSLHSYYCPFLGHPKYIETRDTIKMLLYLFVATYPPCVIQMGTFIQISTFKYDFFSPLAVARFPSGAPLTICLQNILLMRLRKGSSVCLLRTGRY